MSDLANLLPTVEKWLVVRKRVAAATVLQTWQAAPRRAGDRLFVSEDTDVVGSVSAGCVENAVMDAAQQVIQTDMPQRLTFGISDGNAFAVGLACGGEIDVHVTRWRPRLHQQVLKLVRARRAFELLTHLSTGRYAVLQGRHILHWEGDNATDLLRLVTEMPDMTEIFYSAERDIFYQRVLPPPHLVIVGGNHIAVALSKMGGVLGWHITLIDPRTTFANPERFPNVRHIVNQYPQDALPSLHLDPQTAVVILSHDPKLDDPALACALTSEVGYIGVLGSKRTQAHRRERLRESGFTTADIDRIHGPIGLPIGAITPEQIALSILTEITMTFNEIGAGYLYRAKQSASITALPQQITRE
ncbi:MAG: XdhC/CoxI family protein [Chloroflexota bacterium]